MAQLPAPNKAGVSAGHDVLRAKDVDAANKFWQALGGVSSFASLPRAPPRRGRSSSYLFGVSFK
jgi:hypothetical protein